MASRLSRHVADIQFLFAHLAWYRVGSRLPHPVWSISAHFLFSYKAPIFNALRVMRTSSTLFQGDFGQGDLGHRAAQIPAG